MNVFLSKLYFIFFPFIVLDVGAGSLIINGMKWPPLINLMDVTKRFNFFFVFHTYGIAMLYDPIDYQSWNENNGLFSLG